MVRASGSAHMQQNSICQTWLSPCTQELTGTVIACTRSSQKPSLDWRKDHEVPDLAEELLVSMAVGERESTFLRGVTSDGLPVFLEIVLLPCTYRRFVNEFRKTWSQESKVMRGWERLKGRECKVEFSKALDW